MDLDLPVHSCTFDDITMTSSGFRGNPILFEKSGTTYQFQTLYKAA